MRLPLKIGGIIFYREEKQVYYLLLKRVRSFWQSLTGGLEEGETLKEGLLRELEEETGFSNVKHVLEHVDFFQFRGGNLWQSEYVFGIELAKKEQPRLSEEHEEFRWVDFETALEMLEWDTNKESLKKLHTLLDNKKE